MIDHQKAAVIAAETISHRNTENPSNGYFGDFGDLYNAFQTLLNEFKPNGDDPFYKELKESGIGHNEICKILLCNYVYIMIVTNKEGDEYTKQYYSKISQETINYFNVSTRNLKKAILHQLTNHIPVWFGCDVDKFHHKDEALLDNKVFSYDSFPFSKKELFLQKTNAIPYYQTNMNHAMLFTGYYYKATKKQTPLYWLVENSHSSKMKILSFEDNHGHLTMSDSWFDSYMLMAVVDENALQQDTLASKIRDKDNVKILPKWSNLGELLV